MPIPFLPIRTAGQPAIEPVEDTPQGLPDSQSETPTGARRVVPLVGGIAALALAVWAEAIVESKDTTPLSLVLYLAAIFLFAISAWFLPTAAVDLPTASSEAESTDNPRSKPRKPRRAAFMMPVGIGLAVVLNVVSLFILRQDIASLGGALLWLASLALLLVMGIALHRGQGWSPRWGVGAWPQTRRGKWLVALTLVALFAAAVAARFLLLNQVPFGVNADEGDRAALSIRIVRGDSNASIFDIGWYWIANMYFWLLAQFMSIFGIGYVQARAFSAIVGTITAAVMTWLAIRNFGLRVGLLTGAISAVLAVLLQFSRFTSEAGPTAMLWTISAAFFLEAARTGKPWAWIGAGLAGGFALYFYPTGKLWTMVAAGFCLYLLIRGLGRHSRWAIFRGATLAALASVMVMAPFVLNAVAVLQNPQVLYLRAQETSIFTGDNPTRLYYYKPELGMGALLVEQVIRSAGILNQFSDAGGTWPTERPVLYGLLAALTLLGIGWSFLRWRDPRFALIAIWFFVGFIGMVVTVDTPSLQRMSAALPLLALFPALVLDSIARRVEAFVGGDSRRLIRTVRWASSGALVLVVAFLMWGQLNVYFVEYAKVDKWMHSTAQGNAVASQGLDTLVVTIGRQEHMVNSGWVRLMAPDIPRAGIRAPGSHLPLSLPADKNLSFMLFNQQAPYLPYLREIYPGGVTKPFTHTTEGLLFTFYQISKEQRQAAQGVMAHIDNDQTTQVATIGETPPGISTYPATITWTAGLRVPQYWNYAFKAGTPGCASCPAELIIDGTTVLTVPPGSSELTATVSLASGDHYLEYTGTLSAKDQPVPGLAGNPTLLEWASLPEPKEDATQEPPTLDWQPLKTEQLIAAQTEPVGLFGIVQIEDKPEQRRIDRTLANCCLSTLVRADGRPYTATWTGFLDAPATGVYSMTLFSQGLVDLKLDGETALKVDAPDEIYTGASVTLSKGKHEVELDYKVTQGGGGIEWSWIPPGGVPSIVPPSVLSPTEHAGVGPPISFDLLGKKEFQPLDDPLDIVR